MLYSVIARLEFSMNVSLTPELERWVAEKVGSGRYTSASEVIREALRLLEEQEIVKQSHLSEIRAKIDLGLQQLGEGKAIRPEEARATLKRARIK
jgi:antitoxin ParD1/3/4